MIPDKLKTIYQIAQSVQELESGLYGKGFWFKYPVEVQFLFSPQLPDQLCDRPHSATQSVQRVNRAGCAADQSPEFSAED